MKNGKLLLFSACLALILSVTAFAADTVSVTLTLSDGTPSEKTVSCPENALLWYASYTASGEMLEAGRTPVQDGKAAVTLSRDAETVKLFALDGDFKPLSPAAYLKGGSPYQRGRELLASGDYAGAIAAFTEAISANDSAASAYVKRGDALIQSGETAENLASAKADYNAALSLDETLSGAYLGLADVAIRQADYAQAETVLKNALGKASDTDAIAAKIEEIESGNIQDSAGKARRMSAFDAAGALLWRFEYAYDGQNRESSVTSYDASGNQTGRIDLRYDEAGRTLTGYTYDVDTGAMRRIEYEYNAVGKVTEKSYYSLTDELAYSFRFQYDERGNIHKESYYSDEGELVYYYIYTYNENDLWSKRDIYGAGDVQEGCQTMLWTEDGQWSVFCEYDDSGGLVWRWVYDYDATGKRIRWTEYDGEGNVERVTEYE